MKLKLLLLLLLMNGVLCAQDTIRTLIITEVRMDHPPYAYVEITNVGNDAIQLSNFEFGNLKYWDAPYSPPPGQYFMLPEKLLQPGESFVIANFYDHTERQHRIDPDRFVRRRTKIEMWEIADVQLHWPEQFTAETDSITPYAFAMNLDGGTSCVYLEQHLSDVDSVVVDQVGGVFDGPTGLNQNTPYDVAGVTEATYNSILVRKAIVERGNINFSDARGVGITDSEWIPIPKPYNLSNDEYRAVFWTVGNHGNVELNEASLESNILKVDWNQKTITAAWGVRNNDDFMQAFIKKPGLAWHYDLSVAREDSAFNSARTGDKITIYALGNDLQVVTFDIIVKEPTEDQNIVIPKFAIDYTTGYFPLLFDPPSINSGIGEKFEVTSNAATLDTITNGLFGIPYATSKDTLFKYLEKAPKAEWEIVWHDGTERADIQNGDKLRVTAENGSIKEYYIKVWEYRPSHNAQLSAITWPDIPDYYRGLFGWNGDTIPGFSPTGNNYKVIFPADTENIPALVAKTNELNSKVKVNRATSFNGTVEQRTITFTVTAEDGMTEMTYSVVCERERKTENLQPYIAEPFVSELVFRDQFGNGFVELCNPGNQPLDLSNYMVYGGPIINPAEAIVSNSGETSDWGIRNRKYIPGYKWLDQAHWIISPARVEQDLNVNSIVYPGDVFVMGDITRTGNSGYPWFASEACDIDFRHLPDGSISLSSAPGLWYTNNFFLFKILNDSIKLGLKPANDPNDFELIETFGMGDGTPWKVGGHTPGNQITTWIRKPQFYNGETEYKASFGTNADDSQWLMRDRPYFAAAGIRNYPAVILAVASDLGQHFMQEVTAYKSTVTSTIYKVSPGYSMKETIRGITTGTTAGDFLGNITKADDGQTLTVKNVLNGSVLALDAPLSLNDTLIVLSADSVNISKYILNVNEKGLSSDAVITSSRYKVNIDAQPKSANDSNDGIGTISGIEYGTQLKTVLVNITVPSGATLTVIDNEGAYVPLKMLNYDTTYVFVTVNQNIYFEVIAENGITKIIYQLKPEVSQNTAFVTSNVYTVAQKEQLIHYIPRGTSVDRLLAGLIPSYGASIKLVDKYGHERMNGQIVQDDKIIVTSPNGNVKTVYYLSMLRDQYLNQPTYLAYVLSNVYWVDQESMEIEGPTGSTTFVDFYSKINTSMGATSIVVDSNGNERTSGDLNDGDKLKVTSANGKIVVYYDLKLDLTPFNIVEDEEIFIYPNPTNGRINISGVIIGGRIKVFNSLGVGVHEVIVNQNIETIALDDQPAGLYLLVVTNKDKLLGTFKILKK
jgi:hypothetical protein